MLAKEMLEDAKEIIRKGRTDNTMAKRNRTIKTLHPMLEFKQHKSPKNKPMLNSNTANV